MKLFAFRPKGHGPQSFFVLAEDEAQARALVDARVEQGIKNQDPEIAYGASEWERGEYEMALYGHGEVALNDNA